MNIKSYVTYTFVCLLLLFTINRFIIRPTLISSGVSDFALLISYSLPNFIEAMMGTLVITGLLFFLRSRLLNRNWLKSQSVYIIATLAAGIYVVTQEVNLHQFGGVNVYDRNDVVGSILGLLIAFFLLIQFGFLEDDSENLQTELEL